MTLKEKIHNYQKKQYFKAFKFLLNISKLKQILKKNLNVPKIY